MPLRPNRRRKSNSTRNSRRPAFFRPGVESLENRNLLATLLVNTLGDTVDADPYVTSLREAVLAANDSAGADTIQFATAAGPMCSFRIAIAAHPE